MFSDGKKLILVLSALLMLVLFAGCDNQKRIEPAQNPIMTIVVQDLGQIEIEMYPGEAPNTVYNMIQLIEDEFYNGTDFHRVVLDFIIQAGDSARKGNEVDFTIKGEFENNNFENNIHHERGVVSMARKDGNNSASTQFFICITDEKVNDLDGNYAAFGRVTAGMDIVDYINILPATSYGLPVNPPVIESVTVELFGEVYPEPERLDKE